MIIILFFLTLTIICVILGYLEFSSNENKKKNPYTHKLRKEYDPHIVNEVEEYLEALMNDDYEYLSKKK